jgi:ribonuclease III
MYSSDYDQLQDVLAYRFSCQTLLEQALTHPSYHNEYGEGGDYQRLEFLGDSILGMLLAEMLYARFPDSQEGELSRMRSQLVNQGALAGIAREHGLGKFIRLGRGESQTAGRDKDSILCDILESLIAVVYLDGGLDAARKVVMELFDELIDTPHELNASRDTKSELQEILSSRGMSPPEYRLADESGPPHDRRFRFFVLFDNQLIGEGEGRSKKVAQQAAAAVALKMLQENGAVS